MSSPEPSEKPAAGGTGATQITAPLLLWFLVQLGAVLLAALQVPLAARYPEPAERLGFHVLLVVQVVAAGMMFPFLLRDWRHAVTLVATASPFQLAAGYLAGLSARQLLPAAAFVGGWIVVLATWRACFRSPRTNMIGIAVASYLTLGGGMVRYLRLEFDPTETPPSFLETASPLLTTLAAVEGNPTAAGWILMAGMVLAAAGTLAARRHRQPCPAPVPAAA